MTQILVRRLGPAVKQALQARARAHGRSVEAEARAILTAAVAKDPDNLAAAIHAPFAALAVTPDELAPPPRTGALTNPFAHDPA